MKWIYKSSLALVFLVLSSFAVDTDDTNAHIKATFIYNFTRYIEWPAASKTEKFEIAVLGNLNNPLYFELKEMKQRTTRGNQPFEITLYTQVSSIGLCHMIFVAKGKSAELANVVKKVKNYNTLIITEKAGLIDKGAGINFVIKDNKQGFELIYQKK